MSTRVSLTALGFAAACAASAWPKPAVAQRAGDLPVPSAGTDGPVPEDRRAPADAATAPATPAEPTPPSAAGVQSPATTSETAPPLAAAGQEIPTVFPHIQKPVKDAPDGEVEVALPITVGALPTVTDFGGEADLVSTVNRPHPRALTRKWTYSLAGFFRAPMNIGYGPRNDGADGHELHSPPRVPGASSLEWNSVGLVPAPNAGLYINIENARVSANVLLLTDTYWDVGYDHLDEIGGIAQAYVSMKFNEAFGSTGGFVFTVGAFSNRYGMAGPRQQSSGYYQTYLFGRTHVAGEILTGTFHLSDDVDLVVEHGFGAKLEVVPFTNRTHEPPPPIAPWLPDQGPVPLGSNFLHHAHAALFTKGGLHIGAHFLDSWSPNDFALVRGVRAEESRMRVFGGEVHFDDWLIPGNGYVGYSYVDANNLLPLSDAIELLHSKGGVNFKENFFGLVDVRAYTDAVPPPANDSGNVGTLLFQYMLKLSQLQGGAAPLAPAPAKPGEPPAPSAVTTGGSDAGIAVFGMANNVSAALAPCSQTESVYCGDFKQDRFKFGAELSVTPFKHLSIGARFDRVMPDGGNADVAYSAFSPRIMLHTNWISREYVMLSYSRYFLGDEVSARNPAVPAGQTSEGVRPANAFFENPDPNLFVLSAMVSF